MERKKERKRKEGEKNLGEFIYTDSSSGLLASQRDYCSNPTGFFYPDIDIRTRGTTKAERQLSRPDILERKPLLVVVNSNNNIMHYAFSITETLFCSRTTPLFNLSLRPVLSVISASLSRPRSPGTIYTPPPLPSSFSLVAQNATPRDSFQKFPPIHEPVNER